MDKISIKNLEVFANHGVLPEENILGQKFLVTAHLYMDLKEAGISDDLTMSYDYGEICGAIAKFLKSRTLKLIETAAEGLAHMLLVNYPKLASVTVEIKKPWAPIALHLETVSVCVERRRHKAYIAFGSNMGDKEGFVNFGINELNTHPKCRVIKVSPFIKTAPYGYLEQGEFLNGCLLLETLLSPFELLALLNAIEKKAGRERTVHWGPRTLDLDIIFYDNEIIYSDNLCVPHIDMHNRVFVLKPLSLIAPYMIHPIKGKAVIDMLIEAEDTAVK